MTEYLREKPIDQGIFFALDAQGVGKAAIGKDLYAWHGEDVGKRLPIVGHVLEANEARTGVIRWSFSTKEEPKLYLVAVAPVRPSRDQRPNGVVVVGTSIDDGLAQRNQMILSGQPEVDRPDEEQRATAAEVAFFQGKQIMGSTFSASQQQALAANLLVAQGPILRDGQVVSGVRAFELGDTEYLAQARLLPEGLAGEDRIGVITLVDLDQALRPFRTAVLDIAIAFGIALLLGVVLLFVLVHLWVRAFDKLDRGIQEIIAGNKDYQFVVDNQNKVESGLAHGLNIMSAYLQGKPMPDADDIGGGGWSDIAAEMRATENRPPAQVGGVDMRGLMGKSNRTPGDDT